MKLEDNMTAVPSGSGQVESGQVWTERERERETDTDSCPDVDTIISVSAVG